MFLNDEAQKTETVLSAVRKKAIYFKTANHIFLLI